MVVVMTLRCSWWVVVLVIVAVEGDLQEVVQLVAVEIMIMEVVEVVVGLIVMGLETVVILLAVVQLMVVELASVDCSNGLHGCRITDDCTCKRIGRCYCL